MQEIKVFVEIYQVIQNAVNSLRRGETCRQPKIHIIHKFSQYILKMLGVENTCSYRLFDLL
jgi:hypothetical protein